MLYLLLLRKVFEQGVYVAEYQMLSIDTGMDGQVKPFEASRKTYYQSIHDGPQVYMLDSSMANSKNLYSHLAYAEGCHTVAFSSHGKPGAVLDNWDSPNGILISQQDPEDQLRLLAQGRTLYFMSCETASPEFSEQLLGLGAAAVIGFDHKAQWNFQAIKQMWLNFDLGVLQLLLYRQGVEAVRAYRDQYFNMIESVLVNVDEYKAMDYQRMQSVLQAMTISG